MFHSLSTPPPFLFVFLDLIFTEATFFFFSKTYTALEWNSSETKADNSSANTKYTVATTSASTKPNPMLQGGEEKQTNFQSGHNPSLTSQLIDHLLVT